MFAVHDNWTWVLPATAVSPVGVAGGVVSGFTWVLVVTVTAVEVLLVVSVANTAYEYCVPAANPVSVTEVAVAAARVTPVPAVAVDGAVAPGERRTITVERSASVGFVHDRAMLVVVRVPTVSPVTGPGGVVSAGAAVVVVTAATVEVLLVVSMANTAYEYWVLGVSPVSVTEVAVAVTRLTSVPAVVDAGGVAPAARRTMTAARSASVGFVHDRAMRLWCGRPRSARSPGLGGWCPWPGAG